MKISPLQTTSKEAVSKKAIISQERLRCADNRPVRPVHWPADRKLTPMGGRLWVGRLWLGAIISALFLGEGIHPRAIIALVFIVGGILLQSFFDRKTA